VTAVPGGLQAWVDSIDELAAAKRSTMPGVDGDGAKSSSAKRSGPSTSTLNRRIQETEKEIVRLERRRDKLHIDLTSTSDYIELSRLGATLAEVQATLDLKEEEWLELQEALER